MLTSLLVLIMVVHSLVAGFRGTLISAKQGYMLAIVLIAVACFSCVVLGSTALVLVSAVLAVLGIALIQVLLPGLMKRQFKRHAGFVMGLYVTAIMVEAAFASGLTPMMAADWGSGFALSSWGLLAMLAAGVWYFASGALVSWAQGGALKTKTGIDRRVVWRLCFILSLGAGGYVLVLAWLPAYYQQLG